MLPSCFQIYNQMQSEASGRAMVENLKSLLELAIEFEKDTILFYQMLRSFIDDRGVLNGLDNIVEEESRHVDELSLSLVSTRR